MPSIRKYYVRDDGSADQDVVEDGRGMPVGAWVDPPEWTGIGSTHRIEAEPGDGPRNVAPNGAPAWRITAGAWVVRPDSETGQDPPGKLKRRRKRLMRRLAEARSQRREYNSAYFTGHASSTIQSLALELVSDLDDEITRIETKIG